MADDDLKRDHDALDQIVTELTTQPLSTHRKLEQAQSQLLQSAKLASIDQLAADVAHEINSPIGFVSSNLGSLRCCVTGLFKLLQAYEPLARNVSDSSLQAELARLRPEVDLDFMRDDLPQWLLESQDVWVWVEVADSGRGMTEAVQRRVFEPFFTTKPVGQGSSFRV